MNNVILELRKSFEKLNDKTNEANIRYHVITETFLKYYGYDLEHIELEDRTTKGFCDMYVPVAEGNGLPIEVKNGKYPIRVEDIEQIWKYVKFYDEKIALLTNGFEYVLLDFSINPASTRENGDYRAYVVFWFNIFKPKGKEITELKYFEYLNLENLWEKQSTYFFCDVAQFREWKIEQGMKSDSWNVYRCTCFQFYDLYSRKALNKKNYDRVGKLAYEKIDIEVFDEFIQKCKRKGDKTSTKTVRNDFTHIYNMLYELQKHNKIRQISLNDSRKENLVDYEETENKKVPTELCEKDVCTIINFFSEKKNSIRNIVIILLTVTLGMERSQLLKLKWVDFEEKFQIIKMEGRRIELYPLIQWYLQRLYEEKRRNKIKSPFVLQVKYNGKYRPMREWNINDIFDELKQMKEDEKWKNYSPQYVRNCLIRTLFDSGYSLEDIIYITGIEMTNISKCITMEDILQRGSMKINWKKLYGGILCEKYIL